VSHPLPPTAAARRGERAVSHPLPPTAAARRGERAVSHPLPSAAAARGGTGPGTVGFQPQAWHAPEDPHVPDSKMDLCAAPPTDAALRSQETTFAEVLVGGVRIVRVMHFLEIKSVRAASTGKLFVSRDFHGAGQIGVIGGRPPSGNDPNDRFVSNGLTLVACAPIELKQASASVPRSLPCPVPGQASVHRLPVIEELGRMRDLHEVRRLKVGV
jgi:hypothetical protein